MNSLVTSNWGVCKGQGNARFRIWAPDIEHITLVVEGADFPMSRACNGWYEATVGAGPGERYCFRLPGGKAVPDPASHQQDEGISGCSIVVDHAFSWQNGNWIGRPWHEAIIYELHVGTFTPEGTFSAATEKLKGLADTGFTAIELMPIATFEGNRGWGYDGVLQFAPHPVYGTPDELKQLIDTAHGLGMMVFLDVVYNHFGPMSNALSDYAPQFFTDNPSPWGPSPDFANPIVRSYFIESALHWLEVYRFDGLRFDAADRLVCPSSQFDFLTCLTRTIRREISDRHVHLMTEDARNTVVPMEVQEGGSILVDAEWNDDFHHALHVLATSEGGGLYADFAEDPLEKLKKALASGFVYQGDPRPSDNMRGHGEPSHHLPPYRFINFLHNHDQAGNRLRGERLRALIPSPLFSLLETILLLSPQIPLMFMGDEFASTDMFFFFSDHRNVNRPEGIRGRLEQAEKFQGPLPPDAMKLANDPNAAKTMHLSTLDWDKADTDVGRRSMNRMSMLLSKRQRVIWPLLSSNFEKGEIVECPAQSLAVNWRFSTGILELRANLSGKKLDLPAATGHVFHQHGTISGIRYDGFSCQFSLRSTT